MRTIKVVFKGETVGVPPKELGGRYRVEREVKVYDLPDTKAPVDDKYLVFDGKLVAYNPWPISDGGWVTLAKEKVGVVEEKGGRK